MSEVGVPTRGGPWSRRKIREATVNYGNRNNWRGHAACAGADPTLFEQREIRGPVKRLPADVLGVAEDFCRGCPVLADCRTDAEQSHLPLVGLFGGVYRTTNSNGTIERKFDLLGPDFDPNMDIRREHARGTTPP